MIGFDANQDCSGIACAAYAKGARFVCRYLGRVTKAEIDALHAAGLMVVLIWEREAERALGGYDLGVSDGRLARAEADALGAVASVAIYAAADFDALPEEESATVQYFRGFAGSAGATGVYGSGVICQACRAQGIARYTWTPNNRWRGSKQYIAAGNATIVQDVGDKAGLALGIDIDADTAIDGDIGAWLPPAPLVLPEASAVPAAQDLQHALNMAGAMPRLVEDNKWGWRSAAALAAYYDKRGST